MSPRAKVAALGLLGLLWGSAGIQAQSRPKIWIVAPKLVNGVTEEEAYFNYNPLVAGLESIFPCAELLTEDEAAALLRHHRDQSLLTANGEDPSEYLGQIVRADYVISLTFLATGTPRSNPGRMIGAFMWGTRRGRPTARGNAMRPGGDWSSSDLVNELLAQLRPVGYDVCPWVGTIGYKRSVDSTSRSSTTTTEGTGMMGAVVRTGDAVSTTVHTDTYKSHETEEWTFTLARWRTGTGFKVTADGHAAMTSDAEQLAVATNKTCFPQAADGSVSDSRQVSGTNDEVRDHQTVDGKAVGPLLTPRVRVVRADTGGSWMIVVEGTTSGSGAAKATNARKGGCGNWSRDDPAQTGSVPYGRLLSFTLDQVPDNATQLSGKFPDVDGLGGEVTLALTRK